MNKRTRVEAFRVFPDDHQIDIREFGYIGDRFRRTYIGIKLESFPESLVGRGIHFASYMGIRFISRRNCDGTFENQPGIVECIKYLIGAEFASFLIASESIVELFP